MAKGKCAGKGYVMSVDKDALVRIAAEILGVPMAAIILNLAGCIVYRLRETVSDEEAVYIYSPADVRLAGSIIDKGGKDGEVMGWPKGGKFAWVKGAYEAGEMTFERAQKYIPELYKYTKVDPKGFCIDAFINDDGTWQCVSDC